MMKRILIPLVMMLVIPSLAVCERSDAVRKTQSESKSHKAVDKDRLEIIPRSIIVEQIQTEGAVAFSSNVVRFDYGSWKLRDSSHRQLLEIAAALNDPSLEDVPFFYVDGHTCNIGTESNNCALSWRRALSVINFLVNAGDIPPQRLVPRGFGPHDAVKSNNTEEGRKQNRRVVLKKGPLQDEEEREKVCPPVESGNQ